MLKRGVYHKLMVSTLAVNDYHLCIHLYVHSKSHLNYIPYIGKFSRHNIFTDSSKTILADGWIYISDVIPTSELATPFAC